MHRASLGVCAIGGLLLAVAGCANSDIAGLFLLQKQGPNGDRVVAGSLETVAQSTQTSLRQLGLAAELTPYGEQVYIHSATRDGIQFALVLSRQRSAQGAEQTRIRFEWLDHGDPAAGSQIMAKIDAQTRK